MTYKMRLLEPRTKSPENREVRLTIFLFVSIVFRISICRFNVVMM